jgi:hypothetical protein
VAGAGGYYFSPAEQPGRPAIFEAVDGRRHGYGRLSAGRARLAWEFVLGDSDAVADAAVLTRPAAGPPARWEEASGP